MYYVETDYMEFSYINFKTTDSRRDSL